MQVSAVTTRMELEALAPEWNRLLHASSSESIFLTWEYISAWVDAVAPSADLYVLVVRNANDELVGIAPFYRRRIRLRSVLTYRCLCILGGDASPAEYLDLILHRDHEQPVPDALGAALARRSGWDCIWIPRVAEWTGAPERLDRLVHGASALSGRPRQISAVWPMTSSINLSAGANIPGAPAPISTGNSGWTPLSTLTSGS